MSKSFLTRIKKIEKKLELRKPEYLIFSKIGDSPLSFSNGKSSKYITEAKKNEIIEESKRRTGVNPHVHNIHLQFISAKKEMETSS